jgi:hypothetical protein
LAALAQLSLALVVCLFLILAFEWIGFIGDARAF